MATIHVRAPAASRRIALAPIALPLAALAALLLCVPMFRGSPANLTSDESLYLAEAYNIAHGDGFTYTSGEPVTHRSPLYPAALAPAIAISGPDAAYAVQNVIVAINALLVMLIAWRMAGALAGAVAGIATASSAYLTGLGTTLYLDPFQCTFLLLELLALLEAARSGAGRWFAVTGALTGVAFLAKESAVQWAPLGILVWLAVPSLRSLAGLRGSLLFTLTFGAVVAPWFAWVWLHTGTIYMLGQPSPENMALLVVAGAGVTAMSLALMLAPPGAARRVPGLNAVATVAAFALVAGWCAFMLWALERHSGWPYPVDYPAHVTAYLRSVAPQAQPFFLLALAWFWTAWRAARGDECHRLAFATGALFLPFALFAANRNLQLRDALPLVYLSYALLGVAAAEALAALRRAAASSTLDAVLIAGLTVVGVIFVVQQSNAFRSENADPASTTVYLDDWDNPFAAEIARWMESEIPAGAHVLTSRLYFSSLHVETEGRYQIHQVPTVRVDLKPEDPALLVPRSNMFRWGDLDFRPARPEDSWLELQQFAGKGYWIGLRQEELLDYINRHEIDYVVLTGEDVAFSSLAYAAYFTGHPAFTLIEQRSASPADKLFAYRVDRSKLALRPFSLAISPASAAAFERETGLSPEDLADRLRTPVRVTDGEYGVSDREQWAAAAGIDLAAQD